MEIIDLNSVYNTQPLPKEIKFNMTAPRLNNLADSTASSNQDNFRKSTLHNFSTTNYISPFKKKDNGSRKQSPISRHLNQEHNRYANHAQGTH